MRAPLILLALTLALAPASTGCAKKKPETHPPQPPPEAREAAPPPLAPPPAAVPEAPADPLAGDLDAVNRYVQERGLIGDVYYDYDRDEIRGDAAARLRANAAFMSANPQFTFTLEGHCDERGTVAYNVALGDRRATSAKDYLVALGIGGDVMATVSYGKERPVCTEDDESCWGRNRRTHFVVSGRR